MTKEAKAAYDAKYRRERAASIGKQRAAFREGNRERLRLQQAEWFKNNRDTQIKSNAEWHARNKERTASVIAAYHKAHPSLRAQKTARRRASRLNATPKWANDFFMKEAYALAKLRSHVFGFKWHVDHIVPLRSENVSGLHTHTNIEVIPARDNISKSNRHWPDMPAYQNAGGTLAA